MSDIKLTGILTADPSLSGELTPDPVLSSAALLPSGPTGKQGPVWTPKVDEESVLSWKLDDGQTPPEPVNIKGLPGGPAEIDYDELAQHVDVAGLTTYTHEQAQASTTWAIVHNLGFYPSVAAVTYGNNQIIGHVQYTDKNSLTVEFTVALSGFAYLS